MNLFLCKQFMMKIYIFRDFQLKIISLIIPRKEILHYRRKLYLYDDSITKYEFSLVKIEADTKKKTRISFGKF